MGNSFFTRKQHTVSQDLFEIAQQERECINYAAQQQAVGNQIRPGLAANYANAYAHPGAWNNINTTAGANMANMFGTQFTQQQRMQVRALKESDLMGEGALNIPLTMAMDMWRARFKDGWVMEADIIEAGDFYEVCAQRLMAQRLVEVVILADGRRAIRILEPK